MKIRKKVVFFTCCCQCYFFGKNDHHFSFQVWFHFIKFCQAIEHLSMLRGVERMAEETWGLQKIEKVILRIRHLDGSCEHVRTL